MGPPARKSPPARGEYSPIVDASRFLAYGRRAGGRSIGRLFGADNGMDGRAPILPHLLPSWVIRLSRANSLAMPSSASSSPASPGEIETARGRWRSADSGHAVSVPNHVTGPFAAESQELLKQAFDLFRRNYCSTV